MAAAWRVKYMPQPRKVPSLIDLINLLKVIFN